MSKGIFEHKFLQVNCPNGNTKDEYTKIMNGRAKYRDKNIFLNNVEPFPPPQKITCEEKSRLPNLLDKLPNSYFTCVSFLKFVLYFTTRKFTLIEKLFLLK